MTNNEDEWRNKYWELFGRVITTKLPDWAHEEEYRIALPDSLDLRSKSRLVQYPLEILDGVVFGLKTPAEDKAAIIEILNGLVRNRPDLSFAIYEAVFSASRGIEPHYLADIRDEAPRAT